MQSAPAYLEANRPTAPTPKTVDGEVAGIKKGIEDGIKNAEETIKQMPPKSAAQSGPHRLDEGAGETSPTTPR